MGVIQWFKDKMSPPTPEPGLYLSSQTADIFNPSAKEVEEAVRLADKPEEFVTLSWTSVTGETCFIQALGSEGFYNIEYRTSDLKEGYVFQKKNVPSNETLALFTAFWEKQAISLDAAWIKEKVY
ncbi:hypothetical protein [Streptococcus macacae]|uniref:Uncharacterized protein n=1 Tax=Streptococcus macacae NCTC 11558 TaxID=764298 RepID=G5JZ50_9STRE|nr:hypothetical protein [Streptococcus macacae]EHJ52009.1 hypothetical protein STRMA_0467 [Streptococcus macacae NCTC 11558]SUN78303.1 Uncharacterised protein [Streptococcus macacae NCTC 11558]